MLTLQQRKTATQILVVVSVLLSICSFALSRLGKLEIYPFYHWKLYSQPHGSEGFYTNFNLYGVKNNDTVKIKNKGYPYLNKDDFFYLLDGESTDFVNHLHPQESIEKIRSLGEFVAPNYEYYIVIQDSIEPIQFAKESIVFQREILSTKQ